MKTEIASKKKQKAYAFILEKTGLTIKDAAEYLGCNPVFLGQVLRGRKKASKMFFLHLDRAFCISNEKIKMRLDIPALLNEEAEEIKRGNYGTPSEVDEANKKIKWINHLIELDARGELDEIEKIIKENMSQLVKEGKATLDKKMESYSPKTFYFGADTLTNALFMHFLEKNNIWQYK